MAELTESPAPGFSVYLRRRVLIVFAVSLEGRASGIHVDAKIFAVVRFQDRLIARIDEYVERREALEAAKLQE